MIRVSPPDALPPVVMMEGVTDSVELARARATAPSASTAISTGCKLMQTRCTPETGANTFA